METQNQVAIQNFVGRRAKYAETLFQWEAEVEAWACPAVMQPIMLFYCPVYFCPTWIYESRR